MSQSLRVLIVEDNPDDAELLVRELRRSGFSPEWQRVDTEADYLRLLRSDLDMILSDYQMPQFSGSRALELLRQRNIDVPFILVSGTMGEETAVAAMRSGAADYLLKDRLARLGQAVNLALEQARLRKQHRYAEEAFRASEERFRQVVENIRQVFWMTDVEKNRILYVSPGYEEIWGRPGESLYENSRTWVDAIRPEDRERVIQAAAKQSSGEYDEEYRIIRPDRSQRWIHDRAFPIRNAAGNVYRIAGIAEDITERKEIEDALKQSEEEYRSFFEDELTGAFLATVDGKILACNPAFVRIFGFPTTDDARAATVLSLCREEHAWDVLVDRTRNEKKLEYCELEMRRRDGGRVHCVANIIGRFNEHGELMLLRGYLFDETKRRTLEQQLIQSQKMESLGTLAGGIAHDFNNILGIVLGYVALMREQNTLMPDRIEAIEKAARRGTSLVRQLLMFARKTDVLFESIRVNETIHEIAKLLNETFPRTITIRLNLGENLPSVVGDVSQIHQVLLNLCINARDAMPDGGTLSLSTALVPGASLRGEHPSATSPQYVEIVVADSGIGMDEPTRRKIFEPFFTTKGPGKGTGLGLSIVFGVVESHKGFINVTSEKGRGTSFHVFFPVPHQEQKRDVVETRSLSDSPGGTETVLVIEDEEMLSEIVKTILTSKGYTVLTAADGVEAIRVFQQHRNDINLVITDMGLPQMRGERVVRSLREIDPNVKIVIASGYLDPELKTEVSKAGVKAFLSKPYVPDELLLLTRQVLDGEVKTSVP